MPATTARAPGTLHPHDRRTVTNPVAAAVRRHPIAAYYILAFAISWGAIVLAVGPDGFLATGDTIAVAGSVSLAGPTVAGILVTTLTEGLSGLRRLASRLRQWRVGARWYAVALLTGPLVMGTTVTAFSLVSEKFRPDFATADDKASMVIAGIAGGIAVGAFEELGWTGVALPRLRARFGVPATGLLMGLLWSVWHFPFFAETSDPEGTVPQGLLVVVLAL
jgi:membrane protease YdiL (CAAX protease family)